VLRGGGIGRKLMSDARGQGPRARLSLGLGRHF
jgi:hypothetical protein